MSQVLRASNMVRFDTSQQNGKVRRTMEVGFCGQPVPYTR